MYLSIRGQSSGCAHFCRGTRPAARFREARSAWRSLLLLATDPCSIGGLHRTVFTVADTLRNQAATIPDDVAGKELLNILARAGDGKDQMKPEDWLAAMRRSLEK
jgi:hypothetical protein